MSGTVNIPRDLWDDPDFKDEVMSQREAWVWLIANASWKPRSKRVGDLVIDLKRGQDAVSTRFLAKAWMWSEPKVRRFLDKLENRNMISRNTDAGVTVVTLCDYDVFQNKPSGADASETRRPTQVGRTTDANEKKGEIREDSPDANASAFAATSPVKAIFDEGAKLLVGCGLHERSARSFLGKLRKEHPGKDGQILEAILNCSKAGAVDPIPWITAYLKPKPSARPYDLTNFGKQIQ